jgi:iron(III) transport system ATP-binding protein
MGSNNRLEGRVVEKSNAHATMEVFGERLTGMARTQAAVGDTAVGIIRLERMRCASEPGPNRLPMQLEAPMYLGERWELLFTRGHYTARAYADEPLPPGQHYVEFPPEALWVF